MIPLCAPYIRNDEWIRIKDCVDTEWVSYAGKYVQQFEQNLCHYTGAQYAAVTISGTAALHIALIAAGVRQNDEVILPALSFVAPANAIRYQGAWPTFVDVSMADWQMDTGQIIAAIMPVHLLGGMADLDALISIAEDYQLPLIEDAAESLGARWKDKGIGAPHPQEESIKRFVCSSFNGNKIMTTGGGGVLLTNDEATAQLSRHLSTTAKTNDIEFDHDQVGYNYRMNNIAAALGIGQLEQLDFFLDRKKEIAERYTQAFSNQKGITATLPTGTHVTNSYWLYTILLEKNSRNLLNHLTEKGIQTRPLWKALCDLPYLEQCHIHSADNTRHLTNNSLSIPSSVGLSNTDQQKVIHSIQTYLDGCVL